MPQKFLANQRTIEQPRMGADSPVNESYTDAKHVPAVNSYDHQDAAARLRRETYSREYDNSYLLPSSTHDKPREHSEEVRGTRNNSQPRKPNFRDVSSNFDQMYNKRFDRSRLLTLEQKEDYLREKGFR